MVSVARRKKPSKAVIALRRSKARARRLWVCFRITPDEWADIQRFQSTNDDYAPLLGDRVSVDHCHKTGLIRGLLEWRINRAYGLLERACPNNLPDVLRALALYHERPPATTALFGARYGLIGKAQYKRKMIYGPPELSKKRKNKT